MSAPVIISEIRPSCLEPISPSVSETYMGMDFGAGDANQAVWFVQPEGTLVPGAVTPMANAPSLETNGQSDTVSDATQRILDAYAEASSRWFSAMRACIMRDRVRQGLFREEHGLPNSAKIPYERQPLTAAEEATASMAEATIRCLFGDTVSDYAREKFDHAISTGDMRAFKIRLLFIKARDCLHKKKSPMHQEFVKGMDLCIDRAEKLAGCIPDPSPRRMSKAEQEKKRKREEEEKRLREMQPELPLVWPGQENNDSVNQDIDGSDSVQSTDKGIPNDPVGGSCKSQTAICKKDGKEAAVSERTQDSDNVTVTVTVTHDHSGSGKRCNPKKAKSSVVRKARDYNTVEQILDDIEEGKIVPYESSEEICADLKAGLLTPVEALMFTNALDRYLPEGSECVDDSNRFDIESESLGVEDEDDEYDIEDGRAEPASSFSYNPNGFAGEDRLYGESDYWGSDN